MYASTGASQYSQRAMGECGLPGSTWLAPIVPGKIGVSGSSARTSATAWVTKGISASGWRGRVQLVAQLPGVDDVQCAARAWTVPIRSRTNWRYAPRQVVV